MILNLCILVKVECVRCHYVLQAERTGAINGNLFALYLGFLSICVHPRGKLSQERFVNKKDSHPSFNCVAS